MKASIIQLKNGFAPYPEYKDSGIEWIGKIPKEWSTNKLKYLTKINALTLSESTAENFVLQYLDIGNVGTGCINLPEEVVFSKAPSRARRKVTKGSVIIATVRTYLKAIAYFENPDDNLIVSTGFSVLDSSEELFSKYLYHHTLSESFTQKVIAFSTGVSYPAITPVNLGNIITLIPPFETQKKITEYLDEKTELIDRIIERKKRLIELLREKRTEVINQAVTKGLDPNVELVDSGIEWIGKIPKGWEVRRFKRIANIQASNVDKLTNPEDVAVRLCNYVDVYKNERISKDIQFMEATASRSQIRKVGLRKDDVLLTKDSETADDIGIPAIISGDIPNLVSGYHLYVARPNDKVSVGNFLFRYLQSQFVRSYFETSANGVTRFGLGATAVKELPVLVPQVEEQEEIGKYLNEKTALIDQITKRVEVSITVLKEFKSSLISNVVTGKIHI